ncbi:MAG: adenosine deaminase [Bacteroidota bacterium]
MTYATFPKIELHLHLDCSLSYDVVHLLDPAVTESEYRQSFVAPAKCTDLADFITRALKGIALMQTREQLRLVTLDLIRQLAYDHVIYAEIRFAPLEHLHQGLTPFEVVSAVNEAVMEGVAQTGVEVGIIICTLRHYTEAQSMETVQLLDQFQNTRVVGFDIAADEAGFPIDAHLRAFTYAREKGYHCTAHAGEAKGPESVWETLQHFHPARIGHGVRSYEDPALMEWLKKQNIHLEVCPTSNVQTNIFDTIEHHNVDQIYRSGVSMSINTDARTISDVTLGSEYQTLERVFAWTKAHFLKCNLEAVEHAFTTEEVKARLREKLRASY